MAVSTNRIETWTWWAKRSLFCISMLDVVVVPISESTVEFKFTFLIIMQVFASWKELYGSFTTASTPLSTIGGFAHCLADGDTAETCRNQLCGTPDGVLLVPTNDGCVHLLHRFHMDVQTLAVPAGTGELWALLGHGADALPVKILDSLFTMINGEVLRLPTLLDATDNDGVIRVSTVNTRSGTDIYKGLRCVLLPPVLGRVAMSADLDDPWEIFTSIRKAAVDFDVGTATGNRGPTSGTVEESKNDEMVLDDADKATFVFHHVLQLLCIVMEPSLPATGFPINVLTTSRPLEYAHHHKQTHGIDFVPRALGSPGPGTPDIIPQSPQFTAILDAHRNSISAVSQLTTQMTHSNLAMEKRNEKSTSKKGKGKFGAHTLRMALNATQPLPPDMMDEDSDMVTTRTELVTDYNEFFEQGTSGEARTFLGTLLNDKRQCTAHVPASTAIALFMGKLCWTNLEVPEAFSILSCFHMAFSSAVDDSSEAAQSALKVTEGDGLLAEDMEKATKIVHFVPRQFDHMTKMFAIMLALLGVALGNESDAAIACRSWLSHFRKHEMSYLAITWDEPDFYFAFAVTLIAACSCTSRFASLRNRLPTCRDLGCHSTPSRT
jgi:hypothetical protein